MTVFFTSDTHFGHARIIELCQRPFTSVEEMDEAIVVNWNSVVGPKDVVFHLGDFTLAGADAVMDYRRRLNGVVHLVHGNHDRRSVRDNLAMWRTSSPVTEINLDGHFITLCHYPMRSWNGSHRGALMLYGHAHGNAEGTRLSLDVGVDCWDFHPVTLEQILARMATLPEEITVSHRRILP